jgi:cell division protein FtsL
MIDIMTDATPLLAAKRERERMPSRRFWLLFSVLLAAVTVSALAVIDATHVSRRRLNALQQLEIQRNAIQVEYTRLLLEQSSLVSQGKVEDMAVSELGMETPDMSKVVVLGD